MEEELDGEDRVGRDSSWGHRTLRRLGSQGCLEGVTEDAAGVDTCGVLGLSGPEKSREKVCRWRKRAVDQRTACSSVLSPCLPEAPLALAAVTSDTAALVVLWC